MHYTSLLQIGVYSHLLATTGLSQELIRRCSSSIAVAYTPPCCCNLRLVIHTRGEQYCCGSALYGKDAERY
jgi:hypothetical protein